MTSQTEEIEIICAWCKKELGTKEVPLNEKMKGEPTHGICPTCYENWFSGVGSKKQ